MDVLRRKAGAGDEDQESFAWFFTSEYPQVVRLLGVVLSDPAAAEDVAQEAFVRLHRHWDRIATYEAPEAWVRRVALNQAFTWRRREQRRRERETRAPWIAAPAAGTDARDEADEVLRAVRRLPARDRALVGLYHLEDRPLDEVAAVLGISPNAAKVALHRARRRLADLLSEEEAIR